jgi:hypothetical protein
VACKMYPLVSSFGFRDMTTLSKVRISLSVFPVETVSTESASRVLAEVETGTKRILGSFGLKEHDVLIMAKLPNGGRLNRVFE